MSNSFESSGFNEPSEPEPLSEQDLTILSGNLNELEEDIELHTLLKFTNLVLNAWDSEDEEVEEEED